MRLSMSCTVLMAVTYTTLTVSTLLVEYTAPSPASALGSPELEGSYLGDHLDPSAPLGSPAYIQPDIDPNSKPCLHYHRDPEDRRAEVKAKGTYAAGQHYFVGYEFRLGNVHEHLAIFQWYRRFLSLFNVQEMDARGKNALMLPTRLEHELCRSRQVLTRSPQEKSGQVQWPRHSLQPPVHGIGADEAVTGLYTSWHIGKVRHHLDRLVRLRYQQDAQHCISMGHNGRQQW